MEYTISEIKDILRLISNQIYFLKTKNIIKYGTFEFDTSIVQDTDLFKYVRMFYLNVYENILNTTNSLKEHKECLDEMNFVIDEIKTIIRLFTEKKMKAKQEEENLSKLTLNAYIQKKSF